MAASGTDRTDEELMLAAARGDGRAFDALVARRREPAVRFCFRLLLDWQAAEDVAQESFVRLFLMRDRYRPRAKLSTLLFRILKNLCVDELRRRGHWGPVAAEDRDTGRTGAPPSPGTDVFSPEDEVLADEAARAVRRAIEALPASFRAALVLREYEELDYRNIGEIMGWSSAKTRVTIHRARQKLAEALRKAGYGDGA